MNIKLIVILVVIIFQSCKAQQSQSALPEVENHLNGPLDYTHEALEIIQMKANGEELILGKINTDGTVHFNLPEFNIKALYDSIPLQPYNFHSLFSMDSKCKERDLFAETHFDDVYAQKYDPMFIKIYGENVAILFPATNEKMFSNNHYYRNNSYDGESLTVGAKYYWFYMDRTMTYNDECIKTPLRDADNIEVTISADIQLNKGWNFIEESLVEVQNYSSDEYHTTLPKKIQFTQSAPASKKVKWFLIQIMKDEKIQAAKKLYELEPITKEQFEKWLPEKAGNFTRTSYELDKVLDRITSKSNNVFLVFENGNQKMEVAIIDGAKSPDDLEMVNFAFSMDNNFERDDKPTSDTTKKGEVHHISKEDKDKKTAQIISLFKDRIVLQAKGDNMTAEQLWEGIKALDIAAIIE